MEKEEVITTTLDSSANITNSANINVDEKKMLLRERVNRIVSVIGFIIIYATVTLLAILGYIEQAAIVVSSWGVYAHFLCVIFFKSGKYTPDNATASLAGNFAFSSFWCPRMEAGRCKLASNQSRTRQKGRGLRQSAAK